MFTAAAAIICYLFCYDPCRVDDEASTFAYPAVWKKMNPHAIRLLTGRLHLCLRQLARLKSTPPSRPVQTTVEFDGVNFPDEDEMLPPEVKKVRRVEAEIRAWVKMLNDEIRFPMRPPLPPELMHALEFTGRYEHTQGHRLTVNHVTAFRQLRPADIMVNNLTRFEASKRAKRFSRYVRRDVPAGRDERRCRSVSRERHSRRERGHDAVRYKDRRFGNLEHRRRSRSRRRRSRSPKSAKISSVLSSIKREPGETLSHGEEEGDDSSRAEEAGQDDELFDFEDGLIVLDEDILSEGD